MYTAGRNVNWCNNMENSVEVLQKTRNKLPYDPAIQCCVYIYVCVCGENKNINLKRYTHPTVNNSITYNSQDTETT